MTENQSVNLYFQNSKGEEEIVDVGLKGMDAIRKAIKDDVSKRNPNFVIHYERFWEDPNRKRIWFDVGSYTEFYVGDVVDDECETCKI